MLAKNISYQVIIQCLFSLELKMFHDTMGDETIEQDFFEFIGVCAFGFMFLLWIQFHPIKDVKDILNLLRKIFVKAMDFIGQFLQFIGGLLRPETSSADASIKIDVGDQGFLNLTLGDLTLLTSNLQSLAEEEEEMCSEWRHITEEAKTLLIQHEAWCRSNFNYVILCPFLSDNAPRKRFQISTQEAWCTFVRSIIYVGRVSARYLFSISILIFGNLHTYSY